MKFFINNDPAHQKLHKETCHLVKIYKGTKEFKDHWKSFDSLDEAIRFCKNIGRKYRYCKLCFPKKSRGVVR